MRNALKIETKSEAETTDPVDEVKTALAGLTADVETKTKPVADLTKRLEAIEAKANRLAADNDNKTDDNIESKALNSFLRNGTAALEPEEVKTLNIGTSSAGGYVTAPEYSTTIIEKITQMSPMRRLASVMGVGTSKIYIPSLDTNASAGWVTETGTRPSSEPAFGQIEIDNFEQAIVVPISAQLLEDSFVDLQAFLSAHIAKRFAKAEATAFVTGDGSGKPTGVLSDPTDYTAVDANQDGSDIIASLIDLYYSLPTEYAMSATWAMNRKTMGIIRAAADTTTKGTLWSDGLANGTPPRFLGAPVAEFPDLDDLASAESGPPDTYPVVLGDFSNYQIVDRVGIQLMRDDYTGADNGIVKIRARRRVGGKTLLTEAFQVLRGVAS